MAHISVVRSNPGQRSTTPPGGHIPAVPLIPPWVPPPPDAGTLATATDINAVVSEPSHEPVAGEGSTVPVVYGGALVGAKIIAAQFNGGDLLLSCAWCHGEIESFYKIQVNDADPPTSLISTWTANNFRGQQANLSVQITGGNTFGAATGTPFSDFVPYKTIVQFQGFANAANNAAVNVVSVGGGGSSFTTSSALTNEGYKTVSLIDWNLRASLGSQYSDVNAGIAYSVIRVSPGSVSGFPRPTAYVWGMRVPNVQLAYVTLNGSSQYGYVASSAQNTVDEDFEIAVLAAADDWTPAADSVLVGKHAASPNCGYRFGIKATTGYLWLDVSYDGTNLRTFTSTVAVGATDGARKWVRVRFSKTDGANSTADFATSDDGHFWTALGAQRTSTIVANLYASTTQLRFGADSVGNYFAGKVWAVRMQTTSKLVCDMKVLEAGPSASTWTDWAGVPWTLAGSAATGAYVAYSKVPINCLVDFVTNAAYGAGKRADIGTALRVYDLNTMQVGTGTREDYNQIDLVIDSPALTEEWINVLRDYANCAAVLEGDTYYFPRDWKDPSVYSFDSTNIVAGTMQIAKRSSIQQPNVVEVSYTNISKIPWFTDRAIVYRSGVLDGTLPRRASQVNKPGLTRYSEALRYATGRLNDATINDMAISFVVADEGAYVREGDVIDVSFPYTKNDATYTNTFNAKEFRVVASEMQAPGIWGISAIEKNDARYDESVIQTPPPNDTSLPRSDAPPVPAAFTVLESDVFQAATGLWASRIKAAWSPAPYPYTDYYVIEVYDDAGVLCDSGVVPASLSPQWLSKQLPEFVSGTTTLISYSVQYRIKSYPGAIGLPYSASVTLSGKLGTPGDVGSLTGFEVGGEVRLTWSGTRADGSPIDLDWTAVEIRYGLDTDTWPADNSMGSLVLVDRVAAPSVFYATKAVPDSGGNHNKVWRFFIKALDSVRTPGKPYGQYSANATTCDITVTSDTGAFVAVDFDYTTQNLYKMSALTVGNSVAWVSDDGVAFGTKFGSNMDTYTRPLLSYFKPAVSAFVTEAKNHGAQITGDWYGSLPYADLDTGVATEVASVYLELNSAGGTDSNTITNATNATPIVVTVSGTLAYANGDEVLQSGVTGNTNANGRFIIANVNTGAKTYELTDFAGNNVAGNGTFGGSPTVTRWAWFPYATLNAKATAQYSRLRLRTTGVAKITGPGHVRVNCVTRHEGGIVTCAGADYIVTFTNRYNAAVAASATIVDDGATTSDVARCDQLEVSGARGLSALSLQYLLRFYRKDATNGSYVTVGDFSTYEFGGAVDSAFTVEFWFKLASLPGVGSLYGAVTKGTVSGLTGSWEVRVTALGRIRFGLVDETAGAAVDITGSTFLTTGLWYHAACVYTGSSPTTAGNLKIYLNGVLESPTMTIAGSYTRMRDTTTPLEFGRHNNGGSPANYYDGRLDEVRIWNVARTAQQIADNMFLSLTSATNMVGRWGFDEGSGTTATDNGTGAHNGTLTAGGTGSAPSYRPYDGMNVTRLNGTSPQNGKVSWSFDGV